MATRKYNSAFVDYLATRPKDEATRLIGLLSVGAVQALRADYSLWRTVERAIFNPTVLLFCADELTDKDALEMVNYGIQINDLKGFTDDIAPLNRICSDVETRAMKLITRNRVKAD